MNLRRLTVVFAGGGTGGHLYPALAIAEEVRRRRPDARLAFIGAKGKIEARVVPEHGFEFHPIQVSGFDRRLSGQTLLFPVRLGVALAQSFSLLRRIAPAVVVGTGGYVCGPPLFVATVLGIPTLIQEQNSYPGVTTRLLAKRVDQVHLTFASSKRYLERKDNVTVTGNPTRSMFGAVDKNTGAASFGLDPSVQTILVFGGSQGAASLNRAVAGTLKEILELGVQVLWGTGPQDVERVRTRVGALPLEARERVRVHPYIDAMGHAFAAADLAVCRSGASTLAELTRSGLPAILVPYPFAAADHQTENARAMVEAGAAVLVPDAALDRELFPAIKSIVTDGGRRAAMTERARALGAPKAAELLADAVLRLAE